MTLGETYGRIPGFHEAVWETLVYITVFPGP